MIRVLHVLRQLNRGGIECWLHSLMRHWPVASRPEFHFALEEEEFGTLAADFEGLGAILHHCPPPRKTRAAVTRLRSILKENGPFTAVHCHNHHASVFHLSIAAQMGVRARISHSHADFRRLRSKDSTSRKIYTSGARAALNALANIRVGVSQAASDDLFGLGSANVKLIPCGIDFGPYLHPSHRSDPRWFTLVHVGRLVPEKNHAQILKLAARLIQTDARTRLWLVGDGPLRSKLEAQAAALGIEPHVHFWGSRPDIPDLLAASDVFVFPSLAEGLGLAAIEAQAAGLPIVMSSHLPGELDVFPELCQRLAVNLPTEDWVQAIALSRQRTAIPTAAQRYSVLSQSIFSIHENIRSLHQIYAGSTY